MLLIAATLALLVIVFGMKLMAQTQKESLGNLYKYVSWFVVVMGFLCLLGAGLHGVMRCCKMHHERMERHYEMYEHQGCEDGMMMHHRGMMGGCMMQQGGCNEMMSNGNCNNMGGNCDEGKMEQGCNMGDGGSCPMMKDGKHCEEDKDTMVIKKEIKK